MDPRFHQFLDGSHFLNQSMVSDNRRISSNGSRFEFTCHQQNPNVGVPQLLPVPEQYFSNGHAYGSSFDVNDDDSDFSDSVLRYIDHILMDEDIGDKSGMLEGSVDLRAKERSFYEVLGQKYPVSQCTESPNDAPLVNTAHSTTSSSDCSGYLSDMIEPNWFNGRVDSNTSLGSCPSAFVPHYVTLSNSSSNVADGLSPVSPLQIRDMSRESQSVWNFEKGVEEASKFIPCKSNMFVNVISPRQSGLINMERKVEADLDSWIKKTHHVVERDLDEERSNKLPAICTKDSDVPMEEFDDILLNFCKKFQAFTLDKQTAAVKDKQKNDQIKGGRRSGKKRDRKKQVIDLQSLLIACAQSVAADDRRNANELLQQIRQHSSPLGDGNQRLAHYFAIALEGRLAGTGSHMHKTLTNYSATVADYLKAYYTYLVSSPFRRVLKYASNKTILMKSQKAAKIHIIDFGILFGFQWPNFIRLVALRNGGSPKKLKITGIDFPEPGFRPAERIKETGRRLSHYAKTFKVPFEYNAIAQSWETIRLEDLKIEEDEFVIVNCINRTKNLLDETVGGRSARSMVLNLIRRINPAFFIHGVVNGAYSAPFFVTRFREVLFHFSALFDMLENNIPRDKPERQLIERDIFGKEAFNVVACEGRERVERPETYKQWQVRNLRAGFMQVPFDTEVMSKSQHMVTSFYHKEFVIDEESQWLLLGWKGRIIYAISCWQPI